MSEIDDVVESSALDLLRPHPRIAGDASVSYRAKHIRALFDEIDRLLNTISCLTASRDRWKAEAKGKITPEWRAIVEAERPIEG